MATALFTSTVHYAPAAATVFRAVRDCAGCHPAQAKPHPFTSMAHAMESAEECAILKAQAKLAFRDGEYSYSIERRGDASVYTVTDGGRTLTAPIRYAFGLGDAGQTYVYELDGTWYESRVSYFRSVGGLDITMGHRNLTPHTLEQAAGREMGKRDTSQCFRCHSTGSGVGLDVHFATLSPGVQCERCHGESERHAAGIRSGNADARMASLGLNTAERVSRFCGQCHRTWDDVALSGKLGITNVRFQPYRLQNSKCWNAADLRIACTACHDPHSQLDTAAAHYDAKCTGCHTGAVGAAPVCRVATANCTTCHMPKLEMPGSHFRFTDHEIRIVKANEPYPD